MTHAGGPSTTTGSILGPARADEAARTRPLATGDLGSEAGAKKGSASRQHPGAQHNTGHDKHNPRYLSDNVPTREDALHEHEDRDRGHPQ